MPAWKTRGHAAALALIARAVATGRPPQSLLIVGPAGVGKTTLALDLAAGLLCRDQDPRSRPCGSCTSCRRVAHGNHPDLHRLAPTGAGREIRIGSAANPEPGTARSLIHELALAPMEGPVRVAVVEGAGRLNEEAQNALLKLLEEPPPGSCLILCSDDEEALLPTVRSRCARLGLGPVAAADIEALLRERGVADASRASAIARIAEGRPGQAVAYALVPEALVTRERLARELLDLAGAGRVARLAAARGLVAAADELETALERSSDRAADAAAARARSAGSVVGGSSESALDRGGEGSAAGADDSDTQDSRSAPAARRRAVLALGAVWRTVARDLALAARGGRAELRLMDLLEETTRISADLPAGEAERFLERLDTSLGAVELNANPELLLDVLLLAWPRTRESAERGGRSGDRARAAPRGAGD